jgi:transketolase N-terminal domain/subunit
MRASTAKVAAFALGIAIGVVIGIRLLSRAEAKHAQPARALDTGETAQAKIERAMSAGPTEIVGLATIIDKNEQGHTVVLREGTNGFTCIPGQSKGYRRSADVCGRAIHAVGRRFCRS